MRAKKKEKKLRHSEKGTDWFTPIITCVLHPKGEKKNGD